MRIAICDDNKLFADSFKSTVNRVCRSIKLDCIIDVFYNGDDIASKSNEYELIFLDIDMPDISGIEVCRKVNQNKCKDDTPFVVFVTCKENLVFDALKQYPYTFIRKSALEEEIENCICTLYEKLSRSGMYYIIKEGRSSIRINLNDVLYLEKVKNYIYYYTNKATYTERCNMDEKEIELSDKGFVRCHAGYLVNAKHITGVESTKILLDNDKDIPLDKEVKSEFVE